MVVSSVIAIVKLLRVIGVLLLSSAAVEDAVVSSVVTFTSALLRVRVKVRVRPFTRVGLTPDGSKA